MTDATPMVDRDRSRGQLLLVGAVAIAIIILGLVVVYNTVLFTDTNTARGSIQETSEARDFTEQIRKEVKRLAAWQNESVNYSGPLGFDDTRFEKHLRRNITKLSRVQSLSHAQTGPVFVNVTLDNCTSSDGTCNMTLSPNATVVIRWQTDQAAYGTVIEVPLPDNSSVAPSLAPVARPSAAPTGRPAAPVDRANRPREAGRQNGAKP